jgi:hypothetical protein
MDRCGLMRLQDLLKQGVTVNLKNHGNALATHKSPAATVSNTVTARKIEMF